MKKLFLALMMAVACITAFSQTSCTSYFNSVSTYDEYTQTWTELKNTKANIDIVFDSRTSFTVYSANKTTYSAYGAPKSYIGKNDEGRTWTALDQKCSWIEDGKARYGSFRIVIYDVTNDRRLDIFYYIGSTYCVISYWFIVNNN